MLMVFENMSTRIGSVAPMERPPFSLESRLQGLGERRRAVPWTKERSRARAQSRVYIYINDPVRVTPNNAKYENLEIQS